MPSLSCRYLLDTFPDTEDQAPFLSVRINVTLDELYELTAYRFPLLSMLRICARRHLPADSPAGQPNFALPSCLRLEYHRGNNTPEPPQRTRQGFGSPLEAVDGRPFARGVGSISAGCIGRPSGTLVRSDLKRKSEEKLRFNKCEPAVLV